MRVNFNVILSEVKDLNTQTTAFEILRFAPLDLRNKRKYGWNDYFCCVKETDQPTAR